MLLLTNDKNNAVRLRTVFEKMNIEFEIAIGEETARAILSERFMNMIVIDAAALKGGTCWVFSFLHNRRLKVPVLVLGADHTILKEPPPDPSLVRFLPPPLDPQRIQQAVEEVAQMAGNEKNWKPPKSEFPLTSVLDAFEDI